MAAKKTNKGSGIFLDDDPEAFADEYHQRMLASAMGLAHVCARKKCRRRKRCFGPYENGGVPCLTEHAGLAKARFESALRILFPGRRLEDLTDEKTRRSTAAAGR